MITTIQLHEDVKADLNRMKRKRNETYEEVIKAMIKLVKNEKKDRQNFLREGYRELAQETQKLHETWSSTDIDWE